MIISKHECFNDVNRVLQLANQEPVFITDQGQPAQVVLSYQEYNRLNGNKDSIVDLIAMDPADFVEFEPPRLTQDFYKPADLS
ncbi:hypothetical protein TI03_02665 [Achromatium sp. WMS1]|nr:hypothetical protein TI03_02665 [Achromatium sp. WMS1]